MLPLPFPLAYYISLNLLTHVRSPSGSAQQSQTLQSQTRSPSPPLPAITLHFLSASHVSLTLLTHVRSLFSITVANFLAITTVTIYPLPYPPSQYTSSPFSFSCQNFSSSPAICSFLVQHNRRELPHHNNGNQIFLPLTMITLLLRHLPSAYTRISLPFLSTFCYRLRTRVLNLLISTSTTVTKYSFPYPPLH